MEVWTYQNLAYLPITKNASSTFTEYFKSSGWNCTQMDLLGQDVKIFGHLQDPIERHFKGVAEFLTKTNTELLIDDPVWQKVFAHAALDMHSMPVTWAVGPKYKDIKWIPIHRQISTQVLTQRWLNANGFECNLENILWVNPSSDSKLALYHRLKHIHQTLDTNGSLSFFYDSDIVHWNSIWPYIDESGIEHRIY
jgi:hypothetical protein